MNSLQNLVNGSVPGKRDNSRSGDIDKTGQEELQNKNEEPQMSYVWQKTKWTKVCIGSFQECKSWEICLQTPLLEMFRNITKYY